MGITGGVSRCGRLRSIGYHSRPSGVDSVRSLGWIQRGAGIIMSVKTTAQTSLEIKTYLTFMLLWDMSEG